MILICGKLALKPTIIIPLILLPCLNLYVISLKMLILLLYHCIMLSFNEMFYATRELHTKPPFSFFSHFSKLVSQNPGCSLLLLSDNHMSDIPGKSEIIRTHFLASPVPPSAFVVFILQNRHRNCVLFSLNSSPCSMPPTPYMYSRTH